MKKLLILGWLLTLPQTLWLADDKEERQKEKVVSPLLAVLERDERCGQDGELGQEEIFSPRSSRSSLPLMSPTSTMSPTSPPPVGIRLGKKSFNHKHPMNSKYPENEYDLIGFYQREDGTYAPLYRSKDLKDRKGDKKK